MKMNDITRLFKIGLSVLLLTNSMLVASAGGLYLGGQLVYLKDNATQASSNGFLFSEYKPNGSSKFSVGVQFNDRGAVEIGYSKLKQKLPGSWMPSSVVGKEKEVEFQVDAVNVVAKSILPLDQARSLYAKLGGAYLLNFSRDRNGAPESIERPEKISLICSVGGSAKIMEELEIDISWNWVFAPSSALPRMTDPINFLTIGASFHLT